MEPPNIAMVHQWRNFGISGGSFLDPFGVWTCRLLQKLLNNIHVALPSVSVFGYEMQFAQSLRYDGLE